MNINNVTVENLRKQGYKVRVMHQRYSEVSGLRPQGEIPGPERNAKGGITTIEITTPDLKEYSAEAYCNQIDPFNRKIGVKICLGRILKQINKN